MSGWLRAVLLAVALLVGPWALLVLLACCLPPRLLGDLAGIVPELCDDHPAAAPRHKGAASGKVVDGVRIGGRSSRTARTWWSHRRWWR